MVMLLVYCRAEEQASRTDHTHTHTHTPGRPVPRASLLRRDAAVRRRPERGALAGNLTCLNWCGRSCHGRVPGAWRLLLTVASWPWPLPFTTENLRLLAGPEGVQALPQHEELAGGRVLEGSAGRRMMTSFVLPLPCGSVWNMTHSRGEVFFFAAPVCTCGRGCHSPLSAGSAVVPLPRHVHRACVCVCTCPPPTLLRAARGLERGRKTGAPRRLYGGGLPYRSGTPERTTVQELVPHDGRQQHRSTRNHCLGLPWETRTRSPVTALASVPQHPSAHPGSAPVVLADREPNRGYTGTTA